MVWSQFHKATGHLLRLCWRERVPLFYPYKDTRALWFSFVKGLTHEDLTTSCFGLNEVDPTHSPFAHVSQAWSPGWCWLDSGEPSGDGAFTRDYGNLLSTLFYVLAHMKLLWTAASPHDTLQVPQLQLISYYISR
ncbi:uncharacterized protein LOC115065684 [Mus pahari]|uniref:uncharacterized protein LOC115065684 n=1 Tax=Mus pahari TaxID=10093 RepID=UPI00111478A4|nr:uncharacterized protein LOC115065684 [Mus pahari]